MQVLFIHSNSLREHIPQTIPIPITCDIQLPKEEACNVNIMPSVTTLYIQHFPITFMYTMLPQLFVRVYYTGSATLLPKIRQNNILHWPGDIHAALFTWNRIGFVYLIQLEFP